MSSIRLLGSQLSLHKLQVFCVVADLGSISRAAERMGIAQPAVTAHVRAIQEKLGTRLITKQGRNIALTEDGKVVHRWAHDLILRTREMERELGEGPRALRGRAVIGASLTVGGYILPPALARFRKLNPRISIQIQVGASVDCIASLKAGECDLAVTGLDPGQNVDGLELFKLWNEELVLVAATHSGFVGSSVNTDEIGKLPFVVNELGSSKNSLVESVLRPFGIVQRNIAMEIAHPEGIKAAVIADCGLAFLFASSVKTDIANGALRKVETPGLSLSLPMYLMKRREKLLSPVQEKVRNYLEGELNGM